MALGSGGTDKRACLEQVFLVMSQLHFSLRSRLSYAWAVIQNQRYPRGLGVVPFPE